MKKTIMNIRTMAALLIASAAFTACSNEDSAIVGEQPAATQTPQVYTLTLQAANATGAQRRALELDGTKLVAKWAADDELTVRKVYPYPPQDLGGTLTASNVSADGQTCTFSGTLTGDIAVDNQLFLRYHATSGTQDGTLESAAANDQAYAIVTVASVDAGNITIKESKATFNTMTAVLKLTLKDGSDNALNATSLKISVDGTDFFEATPTAATYTTNGAGGVLYFAVPSKGGAAETIAVEKNGGSATPDQINTWLTNLDTYTVTFTATVGSNTYTATKTGYKLAGGKYYATELTMAKVATAYTLAESTVSMIVGSDGKAYAAADKDILPTGVTAAGLVAYKSGSNGLAIALADETSTMNWDNAMGNSGAKAHTPAVTGQTWKLPSYDDIEKMLSKYDDDWNDLNEAIANVGGTGLLAGPENSYWLSDESGDEARYIYDLSSELKTGPKDQNYRVRSVIAF